jgi:DNA-binding winged helix-turn-helix (wHTH) protein
MSNDQSYEFGTFRLDPSERLIWNAERRIDLRGKAFDVLTALLRSEGRAVTKEELLRQVWRNIAVEEANLTVAVSQLRRVLRAESPGNDYIETLPGRGYRFLRHGRPCRSRASRHGSQLSRLGQEKRSETASSALFVTAATDQRNYATCKPGAADLRLCVPIAFSDIACSCGSRS